MPLQDWNGVEDTASDVSGPDDTQTVRLIENGSLLVKGEFGRRPGLGDRIPTSGIVCAEIGPSVVFVASNGWVNSYPQNGTAVLRNLLAGYNVALVPCLAQALQRLYITNDFDAMRVADTGTTNLRTVGIVAPTAPGTITAGAGTGVNAGTHLIRTRYQDQTRNRLSNPSSATSLTVVAGTQVVTVTPPSVADITVTHIIIEMTAAGASAYYRAATIAVGTVSAVLTLTDDVLIQGVSAARDGEFQHLPPPLCALVLEHRQRVWTWGASPRTIACTVTNGSAAVAGAGFSAQWAGRQFIGPDANTYTIQSATATVITLSTAYTGPNLTSTGTVQSGTPSMLGWSRATFPESFDAANFARNITLDTGDSPAAMASYFTDLYLIGTRSMRRLVFTGDPAAGMLLTVPGTLGAFHQRCVCPAGAGLVFGWGRDGMWLIDAMQPKKISQDVETTVQGLIETTRTIERFVCYEPVNRVALFFFCLVGEASCRCAAAYHLDSGTWQLWRFRQGFVAACPNSAYSDRQRLMLVDANGYSWRVGVAANDGGGNGILAPTAGTTTTVTAVNGALPGQILYRPKTSEERLITAATVALITVGTPFATAVAAGEAVYVGSIRQRIQTDWIVGDGQASKLRPSVLIIGLRGAPGSITGKATVRLYKDFDEITPVAITSMSADTWPTGCQPGADGTSWTVDLDAGGADGFIPVPLTADWKRAIRADIIAETPGDGVRFTLVRFASEPRATMSQPVMRE